MTGVGCGGRRIKEGQKEGVEGAPAQAVQLVGQSFALEDHADGVGVPLGDRQRDTEIGGVASASERGCSDVLYDGEAHLWGVRYACGQEKEGALLDGDPCPHAVLHHVWHDRMGCGGNKVGLRCYMASKGGTGRAR